MWSRWLWIAIFVGAGSGARADSVLTNFPSGSLIIPMDVCYQNIDRAWAGYNTTWPTTCPAGSRTNLEQGAGNRSGITRAYGLVWRLLQQNPAIPVNVIIRQNKMAMDEVDLTISGTNPVAKNVLHPQGATSVISTPGISAASIAYRGAPFVIDAAYANQVKAFLRTDARRSSPASRFENVIVHEASVSFTAPVAQTLSRVPAKLAVLDLSDDPTASNPDQNGHGYGYGPLEQLMCNVGFNEVPGGCGGTTATSDLGTTDGTYGVDTGTVFDRFNTVSAFSGNGLISGGYNVLYVPHWTGWRVAGGTATASAAQIAVNTAIGQFLNAGGSVIASCTGIEGLEQIYTNPNGTTISSSTRATVDPGLLMSTSGFFKNSPTLALASTYGDGDWRGVGGSNVSGNPWQFGDPNSLLLQLGDLRLRNGGSSPIANFYSVNGPGYLPGVMRLVTMGGQNMDLMTYRRKDNNPQKGAVIYIGSHNFDSTSVAGQRMIINAIVMVNNLNAPPQPELARSAPVVHDSYVYQGSYIESTSTSNCYPPVAGHFRCYFKSDLNGTNVTSFNAANATWDAAQRIPSPQTRTIYTGVRNPAGTTPTASVPLSVISFTSTNANTLRPVMGMTNNADTTTAINGIRAGGLGGIDRSTPAIVPLSRLVTGGMTRPVIALVGARDGMLHAFYISGGSGMPSPGTELWAYVPYRQLPRIATYNAVVNGSPLVSDVFYGGTWHTLVAITGGLMPEDDLSSTSGHAFNTGVRGAIEVLDISNTTQPAATGWLGADDYTDANGTNYVMGQASGVAHGVIAVAGKRKDVFYLATNNQKLGNEIPAVSLYALDVADGSLVWRWNKSYTRVTDVFWQWNGNTQVNYPVPNSVPAIPAVISSPGNGTLDDRIYFGDFDGDLWQIDARTGTPAYRLYPLPPAISPATASPIVNSLTLFRTDSSSLNRLRAIFTRGAADFMSTTAPSFLTVVEMEYPAASAGPRDHLINLPASGNERYLGAVTLQGGDAYMLTSFGSLSGGILASRTDNGNLMRLNVATGAFTETVALKKGATEVTVASDGSVIATSAAGITQVSANTNATARNTAGTKLNYRALKPMTVRAWLDLR